MLRGPAQLVEAFLQAYSHGLFPMADSATGRTRRRGRTVINWYSPDPRAIIELSAPAESGGFRVSRSLRRTVRARRFAVTADIAFERVIRACAEPGPGRGDPWLDDGLVDAYTLLHQAGHAHSIEAWLPAAAGSAGDAGIPHSAPHSPSDSEFPSESVLVGGVYGVHIGGAFFAESMFCRPALGGTDASKVCLVHLVEHLRARGFTLLDVQIANDHTRRFGVVEIPRADYLARLAPAVGRPIAWHPFDPLLAVDR
jgi:leucyl/phenylalanyl-tRNA---protein transferase